jgi:hypothetical protein
VDVQALEKSLRNIIEKGDLGKICWERLQQKFLSTGEVISKDHFEGVLSAEQYQQLMCYLWENEYIVSSPKRKSFTESRANKWTASNFSKKNFAVTEKSNSGILQAAHDFLASKSLLLPET